MAVLYITVEGFSRLLAHSNGINCKLGTGVTVAADENVFFRGLQGKLVCHRVYSALEFHFRAFEQVAVLHALSYGENDQFSLELQKFALVIFRSKPVVFIEYRSAFPEYD